MQQDTSEIPEEAPTPDEVPEEGYDSIDGPSEEEAYLQGTHTTVASFLSLPDLVL